MRYPWRRVGLFAMRALFIAGLMAIFYVGWRLLYEDVRYWFYGYIVVMLSYLVILMAFMTVYGGMRVGEQRVSGLILSCFLALLFANVSIYFEFSLIAYAMLPVLDMAIITGVQMAYCVLACYLMNKAYFAMSPAWEVVAVYGEDSEDRRTIEKMRAIHKVYRIAKTVDAEKPLETILQEIAPYESVLIGSFEAGKKNAILNACYRARKRINLIPSPMDVILNNAVKTQIMDTPVLLCRNQELSIEQQGLKRVTDILASLAGLVITSPIWLVIAIAIKATDGGPVLYRQLRLTKGGRQFNMLKFRSMRPDAEDGLEPGHLLVQDEDPRVTGVGRVIRRFRLDELPQFINILKGEMSLVGPRPERPEVYRQCQADLPEFDLRLNVKAGLTGYAQIYGRYNTSLRDKLNLDLFYIENYSPVQDLSLIMMTLKVLFIKESSQGQARQEED